MDRTCVEIGVTRRVRLLIQVTTNDTWIDKRIGLKTKKSDSRRTFGTKITNHAYLIDKTLFVPSLVAQYSCYYHVANGKRFLDATQLIISSKVPQR